MPRTKEVFKPGEICHVFVHKLQQSGRVSGGNMSFEGDTFFSYRWYALAKHLNKKINGKPVILLTKDHYSNTTAGHLSAIRGAISDKDFHIVRLERAGDIPYSIRKLFSDIETSKKKQAKFTNALVRFKYEGEISAAVDEIDELKKLFPKQFSPEQNKLLAKIRRELMPEKEMFAGLNKYRKLLTDRAKKKEETEKLSEANRNGFDTWEEYQQDLKAKNDAEMVLARAAGFNDVWSYRRHLSDKEEKRSAAENYQKWLAGETSRCPYEYARDENGFTRFVSANGMFRTALGIEMPLPTFAGLFERFEQGRITVGSKVLDFPVSEITSEAIRIGCHTLRIADLKQLATQIQ